MMPEIKRELNPGASFLDVHSTHAPWWRTDYRAGVPGSASMAGTLKANNELWAYARETYHGPVIGEGYPPTSWLHSGNLDSVMATANSKTRLFVDFILLKIRPLQINHGAGYFERWNPRAYSVTDWMLCPLTPEEYAKYFLQEIAFQTAATIDDKIKGKPVLAATQYYLKRPLIDRLLGQTPSSILYHDGEKWLSPSQAILSQNSKIQRLKLSFADSSVVIINFGSSPWEAESGLLLAPLSFIAKGADFRAESNQVDSLYFDYFGSRDSYYLNPRNYDWALEPLGTAVMGRGEGGPAIFHNDGTASVSQGPLCSDTAVSLIRENAGSWRLRFFPQRQAGTVKIDLSALGGSLLKVQALNGDGDPLDSKLDGNSAEGNMLTIRHSDPEVWSYRLDVLQKTH